MIDVIIAHILASISFLHPKKSLHNHEKPTTKHKDKLTQIKKKLSTIYKIHASRISTTFINVGPNCAITFNITGRTCLPNSRQYGRLDYVMFNTKYLHTDQQDPRQLLSIPGKLLSSHNALCLISSEHYSFLQSITYLCSTLSF